MTDPSPSMADDLRYMRRLADKALRAARRDEALEHLPTTEELFEKLQELRASAGPRVTLLTEVQCTDFLRGVRFAIDQLPISLDVHLLCGHLAPGETLDREAVKFRDGQVFACATTRRITAVLGFPYVGIVSALVDGPKSIELKSNGWAPRSIALPRDWWMPPDETHVLSYATLWPSGDDHA